MKSFKLGFLALAAFILMGFFIPRQELFQSSFGDLVTAELTNVISVQFPYNINTDLVNVTKVNLGDVTQSNSKALVSSGAASTSSAIMETIDVGRYLPGQGLLSRFTAMFMAGIAGNTQFALLGDGDDAFGFGYNATLFGILHRSNVTGSVVETFIAQTVWSVDKMLDSTGLSGQILVPEVLNVYSVQMQFLGAGAVKFYVEDSDTGKLQLVHILEYANTNTNPILGNPTLPLRLESINTSNTTDIIISTSSMGAYVEGRLIQSGPGNSVSNSKTTITAETNIVTLQNKTTYQGVTNRVSLLVKSVSVSTETGSKAVQIGVIKNTALGGVPSFTDVSTNTTPAAFDVAGTTITGGNVILSPQLQKLDSYTSEAALDIVLRPGDTLTVSAASSVATDASVTISFESLF